ncbi:MAG: DUF2442 domain-containing protein [Pyrinomonadaceae bacterium]|nr:DUF2442 domain-containing protein [Pyrinomonadaceae bacterium]
MIKVINAKANDDHTLDLQFTDGRTKRFDMRPYLKYPVFERLNDIAYFMDITLVFGTVQWKNEEDISPETLYMEGVETGETIGV